MEILDQRDLAAWASQIEALQLQRGEAVNAAALAQSNFNERVNILNLDLAKISALNNSILALDAEIAREDTAAQALDQKALSKEGTRGKAEADLAAARAALGEVLNRQWVKALESLAASNVVDGLELQRRWKAGKQRQLPHKPWDATTIPFGNATLGFPAPETADFKSLDAQLQALDEMVDAVSDVIVAESVYHLVQGNPLRSGATLDAIATGEMAPPELEVVRTPRTGIGFTHRVLTLWSSSLNTNEPASQWNTNANQVRAQAEPFLNAWAAKLLGNPTRVRCQAEYVHCRPAGCWRLQKSLSISCSSLRWTWCFWSKGMGRLSGRNWNNGWLYQLLRTRPGSDEAEVRLIFTRNPAWQADVVGIGELVEVARMVRKLIAGSRADRRPRPFPA